MSTIDPGASVGGNGGAQPLPGDGVAGTPPQGSVAGSPPAGLNWDTAPQQFRDAHQATQTKYQQTTQELESWKKFGNIQDVQRAHQTFTKLSGEATQLGQSLGYDSTEVLDAFQQDPAGTIAFLRGKAREAQGSQNQPITPAEIQKLVKQQLKPFEQERERALDEKAESRFDGEFDRQFKTSFPNGLPDSNREAISGLAWQLVIDNPDAYKALRSGDPQHVQAAFDQAKKMFLKIVAEYGEHEKKRISGEIRTPAAPRTPQNKARTLDDIAAALNDESVPLDMALGR